MKNKKIVNKEPFEKEVEKLRMNWEKKGFKVSERSKVDWESYNTMYIVLEKDKVEVTISIVQEDLYPFKIQVKEEYDNIHDDEIPWKLKIKSYLVGFKISEDEFFIGSEDEFNIEYPIDMDFPENVKLSPEQKAERIKFKKELNEMIDKLFDKNR